MRETKSFCIAWRTIEGDKGYGDVYFTYDEAEEICNTLNEQYIHMFHYPLHIEETGEDNCQPE